MSILPDVRKALLKIGASETGDVLGNEMLQGLWGQIQDLRAEMNEAKKAAAAEAAKPYLEAIEQIEKRYAMFLKLSSTDVRENKR
jgi:ribulose kinase